MHLTWFLDMKKFGFKAVILSRKVEKFKFKHPLELANKVIIRNFGRIMKIVQYILHMYNNLNGDFQKCIIFLSKICTELIRKMLQDTSI